MQALKALVIFLGILIVIGLGVLGYGISAKFGKLGAEDKAASPAPLAGNVKLPPETGNPNPPGGWTAFGEVTLSLPEGARIVSVSQSGTLLLAHFARPSGDAGVALFDLVRGQALGTVNFTPLPPRTAAGAQ